MPSKTEDIEYAIRTVMPGEPVTLEAMEEALYRGYPTLRGEERTWIGIAVDNMLDDGRLIGKEDCRAYHGHELTCMVVKA